MLMRLLCKVNKAAAGGSCWIRSTGPKGGPVTGLARYPNCVRLPQQLTPSSSKTWSLGAVLWVGEATGLRAEECSCSCYSVLALLTRTAAPGRHERPQLRVADQGWLQAEPTSARRGSWMSRWRPDGAQVCILPRGIANWSVKHSALTVLTGWGPGKASHCTCGLLCSVGQLQCWIAVALAN